MRNKKRFIILFRNPKFLIIFFQKIQQDEGQNQYFKINKFDLNLRILIKKETTALFKDYFMLLRNTI